MARIIEVKYCKKCGQQERVASTLDMRTDQLVVQVWCPCSEQSMRVTKMGAHEPYTLCVEVKQEAISNDGDDQGDVLEEHEQEAEGL